LDAPEFQTGGPGYAPDRFYTQSKNGPQGERRWVSLGRQTIPAEMMAVAEDLIHSRKFPAYHSLGDVIRDGLVHILYRRLSEANDVLFSNRRDALARLLDLERIEVQRSAETELVRRWEELLRKEEDRDRRAMLVTAAEGHLDEMEPGYWRDRLEEAVSMARKMAR
jgi:hypothetical protein